MTRIYHCPHCRTQNFATQERLRLARCVPLLCWKCGQEIQSPIAQKDSKGTKTKSRKTKRVQGDKA